MRVLVCGGRDFEDYVHAARVLDVLHADHEIELVIHGGARGADHCADRWARARLVTRKVYPALWAQFGKSAGMIRNKAMLADGKPDVVVAFHGGKGTANMVVLARDARVTVVLPCWSCAESGLRRVVPMWTRAVRPRFAEGRMSDIAHAVVEVYTGPYGVCTKCRRDVGIAVVTVHDRPSGALCVRACAACLLDLVELPGTRVHRTQGEG